MASLKPSLTRESFDSALDFLKIIELVTSLQLRVGLLTAMEKGLVISEALSEPSMKQGSRKTQHNPSADSE